MKSPIRQSENRLRMAFHEEVATAAPLLKETIYADWDDQIKTYLNTLRPWLTRRDLQLIPHSEFNLLPNRTLPFNVFGYAYFRAWLRKKGIDPNNYQVRKGTRKPSKDCRAY